MFSKLFASKIEKEMMQVCPPGSELMLQYRDSSESFIVSQMLKIYRDSVVLLGFYAKLRTKDVSVKILRSGLSFDTSVKRTGKDKNGNALFYCDMPTAITRPKASPSHFKIYPNGSVKLLLTTNRGEKSVVMPIWEFADYGLTLANETDVELKIGTKLFQALVTVGALNAQLVNMQVPIRAWIPDPKDPCGYSHVSLLQNPVRLPKCSRLPKVWYQNPSPKRSDSQAAYLKGRPVTRLTYGFSLL